MDLLSIVPLWLINFFVITPDPAAPGTTASPSLNFQIFRIIRLTRLVKITRILKASKIFKRIETSMTITYAALGMAGRAGRRGQVEAEGSSRGMASPLEQIFMVGGTRTPALATDAVRHR